MEGAIYVTNTSNAKLSLSGKVDTTYTAINASCSNKCSLKNKGCYAQVSFVGMTNNRLNKEAKKLSALDVARAEAFAIDSSYNGKSIPIGKYLRIHTSGDSKTIAGTKLINNAIKRWKKRGGNLVWSYTHSWSNVKRSHWSNVSVLASITNVSEVKLAKKQGYAPAIVVPNHKTDKAYYLKGSKVKWIPCPAQTKNNVTCESCKLCMKADWLFKTNRGIAFEAHGINKNTVKKHLTVIR